MMVPECVNILQIEDNEVDVRAMRRAFRKHRIDNPLRVARDGIEALSILNGERGDPLERPHVILLDLNLPRMNGLEFLQHLRRDDRLRKTVVFVLTTSSRVQDRAEAYSLNAAGFIRKDQVGVGFEGLVEMLNSYLKVVDLPDEELS